MWPIVFFLLNGVSKRVNVMKCLKNNFELNRLPLDVRQIKPAVSREKKAFPN